MALHPHRPPSRPALATDMAKAVAVVTIAPPAEIVNRSADFANADHKPSRYTLPASLDSASPVAYRTRLRLERDEAQQALALLSLPRPSGFAAPEPLREGELFDETALGVLSARQSTNFRGYKQVTFGPKDSERLAHLLRSLQHCEAGVLEQPSHTHVVLARPYRTPFTLLLTFVGHKPLWSLASVANRAWHKRIHHGDDIPTIGYLPQLHVGILADAMERAAVIASAGTRLAQVFMQPFCGVGRQVNKPVAHALEELCDLTLADRAEGWKVALVAQVGTALPAERPAIQPQLLRKIGANLVAFRSERVLPGYNFEDKAPDSYKHRQNMDISDDLAVQCGRAGYNAFAHWTGCNREHAKELLLLDRVDSLTPDGERRLAEMSDQQNRVTDKLIQNLPLWADLPMGKALSRNAERGRKAFALVGQRIYICGLSRRDVQRAGLDWDHAVRAAGAAASRSALMAELMGVTELPEGADLLAGICLMAGPVNQNDIGKQFYGEKDLLDENYGDREPTSLLVWTLKAKTVADPVGNEEQLLNPARKGALVDLRPGPHEVCQVAQSGGLKPLRLREGRVNGERAFGELGNFVTAADGREIAGNRGSAWPATWSQASLWPDDIAPGRAATGGHRAVGRQV